ncbi:hypothetical protein ALI144C_18860 [Actinosynnema sp. ALI-1.44]|uniref:hypothetical protein n=1 Tax=Actinosynnema sp. ALI-1.44 TaxID=1933779 RepID=UPI00097C1CED|nr:hypothetical protein [Actinosynnema sp. ALI-1.44]ONI81404.1 hypothetical protein ALI144C_18860 [Actinosynnema sp. ALI-1.44]
MGFAPHLLVLLAGRVAQAVGGSGLVIVAISVAGTTRRTGAVTAGVGLVGAFGPQASRRIRPAAGGAVTGVRRAGGRDLRSVDVLRWNPS